MVGTATTARASKLRAFYLPIFVILGIAISVLVFQTLSPGPDDSFILNQEFLTNATLQHLLLSATSFGVVLVAGVPLGVLVALGGRLPRLFVFLLANVGQAVPGIGILALLTLWLGLGALPTIVALIVYGMLPVLRNTVAGIEGVDPAAVESARGMGMTRWQALIRVQLPLASPLIFAGLRTTLVLIVGTATLGNFINGGGLGDVISAGITRSDRIVFVGAVMVAALALLADWLLSLVEAVLVPRRTTT
jgi:osmoprotectant transport system permease protein